MTDITEYISEQTLSRMEKSISDVFGVATMILNQFGKSHSGGTVFSAELNERLNTTAGAVECM